MTANAPTRSTGTLTLGFGLITIPVMVFSAIEDSGIKRQRFTKDGHEVGMQNYDKETGAAVTFADVVTKYRTESDELVELTDDEIASAVGATNGLANIVSFVPLPYLAGGDDGTDPTQQRDSCRSAPTTASRRSRRSTRRSRC
jgi:non-homologous end joining protein Ku